MKIPHTVTDMPRSAFRAPFSVQHALGTPARTIKELRKGDLYDRTGTSQVRTDTSPSSAETALWRSNHHFDTTRFVGVASQDSLTPPRALSSTAGDGSMTHYNTFLSDLDLDVNGGLKVGGADKQADE